MKPKQIRKELILEFKNKLDICIYFQGHFSEAYYA